MSLKSLSDMFLFRACSLSFSGSYFPFPKHCIIEWAKSEALPPTLPLFWLKYLQGYQTATYCWSSPHSPPFIHQDVLLFKGVSKFNGQDQILATWFFSSGSEFLSGIFLFFIFFLFFSGWFLVINTNSQHLLNVLISTAKGPYSTKYQSMPFPFVTPEWASVFITTSWPVICPTRSCKGGIQAVCRWSNCGKTLCSTLQVFIIMLFFNHLFF